MKKYLSGIIAALTAIGTIALSPPKSGNALDVTFYYTATNFSSSEVAKKENWSSSSPLPNCLGLQYKACKLVIDADETVLDQNGNSILINDILTMPGNGGVINGHVPDPATPGYVSRNDRP